MSNNVCHGHSNIDNVCWVRCRTFGVVLALLGNESLDSGVTIEDKYFSVPSLTLCFNHSMIVCTVSYIYVHE